ncbi:Fe-S cluster assembly ATPase SufC [Candidatus Dependentiae bacterium]|nr:Fe-S cluster assembly ATPase SufC [Candidatus Dependentiae bacterium]
MFCIENLTVEVENKKIINNLKLEIKKSSLHVIMGPNGCGKSSLAFTIMGHPSYLASGKILLDNNDIISLPTELRAKLGIFLSFQNPLEIPGLQVFNFLKECYKNFFSSDISITDFKKILLPYIELLKLDESVLYRTLEGFSGGERKKLELLQMLLFKPKLAILDEIDSGLDITSLEIAAQAINFAREENPTISILLITHYPRILKFLNVDKIHIINNGKISATGSRQLADQLEELGYEKFFHQNP